MEETIEIVGNSQEAAVSFEAGLLALFKMGGFFMWPLLAFSVAALAIVIDRLWYFAARNPHPRGLAAPLEHALRTGSAIEWDKTEKLLESALKRRPAAALLLTFMRERALPLERLERLLETEARAILSESERGLPFLSVIATLAPLTGFLGTVSGMLGAFRSIAAAVDVSAQVVAHGIYEALVTTVFGLSIAIVAGVAGALLDARVSRCSAEIEQTLNALLYRHAANARPESHKEPDYAA
jgi:biopolymer transport protein ExbB